MVGVLEGHSSDEILTNMAAVTQMPGVEELELKSVAEIFVDVLNSQMVTQILAEEDARKAALLGELDSNDEGEAAVLSEEQKRELAGAESAFQIYILIRTLSDKGKKGLLAREILDWLQNHNTIAQIIMQELRKDFGVDIGVIAAESDQFTPSSSTPMASPAMLSQSGTSVPNLSLSSSVIQGDNTSTTTQIRAPVRPKGAQWAYLALEKFHDEKSGKSLTDPALHVQPHAFFFKRVNRIEIIREDKLEDVYFKTPDNCLRFNKPADEWLRNFLNVVPRDNPTNKLEMFLQEVPFLGHEFDACERLEGLSWHPLVRVSKYVEEILHSALWCALLINALIIFGYRSELGSDGVKIDQSTSNIISLLSVFHLILSCEF